MVTTQAAETPAVTPQPDKPKRATRVARVNRPAADVDAPAPESAPKLVMTIPVSAPELHARMKPVLARGTKMPIAVEGFRDAEQFATLAHAAKNTQVPFILLKHRVIAEGQSLEDSDPRVEARPRRQGRGGARPRRGQVRHRRADGNGIRDARASSN